MTDTFFIQTFGCQMNERDSETLAGMLMDLGYRESSEKEKADIVVINTCSIREHADERFFGILGQLKKLKENNQDMIVALCGCMMQQQHIIERVKTKFPWVDVIFGTHNIHEFPKLIKALIDEKQRQIHVWDEGGDIVEGLPSKRKFKYKSFVNIMQGCNNFCTYCIVPFTRGRERSRTPEVVTSEVRELVADGVKEITLLGQNVNSYRGEGNVDFPNLLKKLNSVEGLERIRFMTSHPKDISDDLISCFKELDKLCSHIHLPVQSGSDSVLKRMNRHYDRKRYLDIIRKLRKACPDIAISTDIIVGFPGETEEDFQDTLDLINEVEFDSAFTFIYSVRKGTPAERYEDHIPEEVKHSRFTRLVEAINASATKKNEVLQGSICSVLVEGRSKHGKESVCGRTEGFKLVDFSGNESMIGEIVDVKITRGRTFSLTGELQR